MQQMFTVGQIICGIYLFILAAIDVRIKKIPIWIVAVGAAAAFSIIQPGKSGVLALAGAAVGVVFLIVSKVTNEGLGYGDSLVILVMGIYLGFWELLGVLVVAFLLSSIFAVIYLIRKKLDRRAGFPFIPFLFLAYLIWMCMGGA